ncbi:MAG TPA: hypothetical protein VKE40_24890, partial [Gemmataceae bacterium]|nr:hypothetical protein [Gemmataceae bacterium]
MLKRLREWRFRYTWLIGIAIALLTFGVWRSWIGLTGPPTACLTFQPSPLEPALAEAKRDHAALFDARFGPGAEWEVRHRLAQSENRALLALSDLEDAVAADNAARAAAARRG